MPDYYHRFKDRTAWRRWLELNHAQDEANWVVLQKVKSANVGIRYAEALDEALCFGWIDGKVKRIDDDEHIQWFSPRRRNSPWSRRNRDKVGTLIREGLMTDSGLAAIKKAKENGRWEAAYAPMEPTIISDELLDALKSNRVVNDNFMAFPNSARLMYASWANKAKRESTRARRIKQVVERAEANKKPGVDL